MSDVLAGVAVLAVSAIPWGEVFFAVPLGIGLGLTAPLVFALAVIGNVGSVLGLLFLCSRLPRLQGLLVRGRRGTWAAKQFRRFGVAGLAVQAPLLSGSHVAALIGVFLGASSRLLLTWLTASILGWAAAITVLAVQGKRLVLGFLW